MTLRILVDIDLLTENILARHGQVDEGLTAKVAISELLTKFETKHAPQQNVYAMPGFSVGIKSIF